MPKKRKEIQGTLQANAKKHIQIHRRMYININTSKEKPANPRKTASKYKHMQGYTYKSITKGKQI